jgi:hypothetical protein
MKMLDQEIAASRPVSKQRAHLRKRLWINLAALWRAWRTTAATARGDLSRLGPLCSDVHPFSFSPTKTHLNRGACKPYPPNRTIEIFYQYPAPACIFLITLP